MKYFLALTLFLIPLSNLGAATFSSSIQLIYGSTNTATVGKGVDFHVVTGNKNSITYNLSDSFSGTSISNNNIGSTGLFYWVPNSGDIGVHNITTNLVDQFGNTSSANVQINVLAPLTVSIGSINPSSSININQTVYFSTQISGFTSPTYSVSDSMLSSSVRADNINSFGNFYWAPKIQDVGSHSLTIIVTDSSGRTASAVQSISVAIATATIQSLLPGSSIYAREDVTFKVAPVGFTNPAYSASDSVFGSSVNSGSVNSDGIFRWTPGLGDLGLHTITITVSDSSGNLTTASQQITVSGAGVRIVSVKPGTIINVGTPFLLTATTTGFNPPYYSVSDSISGTSLSTKNINELGLLNWTPTPSDIGTHSIRILVIDGHGNTANSQVTIIVNPAGSPVPATTTAVISTTTTTQQPNPSNSNKYVFARPLAFGSSNKDVTELQKRLTSLGLYSGPVTGYFGGLTQAAVKRLQAKYYLEQVGSVGPATRKLLNSGI